MGTPGTFQRLTAVLLSAFLLGISLVGVRPALASPDKPELGLIAPEPNIPGSVEVRGSGFSPGGEVWVAIIDVEAGHSQVAKALQSTKATSADGTIDVVFVPRSLDYDCEMTDVIRAFDTTTGQWTDEVYLGCALTDPTRQPIRYTPY